MDSDVGTDGDSDRHIDSQIEYAPRHSALNAGHNIWVAEPRPLAEMGANFDRAVRACVRRETVSFRGVRNTFLKAAKGGKVGLRLSGNGSELGGGRSRSRSIGPVVPDPYRLRTRTYLSLSIYRRKEGKLVATGGRGRADKANARTRRKRSCWAPAEVVR